MTADTELRWDGVTKDPEETLGVELSLFGLCANYWTANEQHQVGDFVWPTRPNGYVYECTTAGRTGRIEPRWNIVADQALATLDGSVQWTCRRGDLQGLTPVTGTPVATATGLTVSAVVINEGTKLLVDYTGGTLDSDYEAKFTFTIAGRTRIGRQTVYVRNK